MKALLDTDMLSEVLKAKDRTVAGRAVSYVAQHGRYTFSTITVMEVVKGMSRKAARTPSLGFSASSPGARCSR